MKSSISLLSFGTQAPAKTSTQSFHQLKFHGVPMLYDMALGSVTSQINDTFLVLGWLQPLVLLAPPTSSPSIPIVFISIGVIPVPFAKKSEMIPYEISPRTADSVNSREGKERKGKGNRGISLVVFNTGWVGVKGADGWVRVCGKWRFLVASPPRKLQSGNL